MPLEETWSPEKIEAWRVIGVKSDGAPNQHPVGVEMKATCTATSDDILIACEETPGENCASGYGDGCGYYAYKTREQAVEHQATGLFLPYKGSSRAIARVLLSGKVIEHEKGYRAEILEVVSFEAPPEKKPFVPPGSTIPRFIGSGYKSDPLMAHWFAFSSRTTKDDPYKNIADGGV